MKSHIEYGRVSFARIGPSTSVSKMREGLSDHRWKNWSIANLESVTLYECVYEVDRDRIMGYEPLDVDAFQVIVQHNGELMITAPTRDRHNVRINLDERFAVKLEDSHLQNQRGVLIAYTSIDPRGYQPMGMGG